MTAGPDADHSSSLQKRIDDLEGALEVAMDANHGLRVSLYLLVKQLGEQNILDGAAFSQTLGRYKGECLEADSCAALVMDELRETLLGSDPQSPLTLRQSLLRIVRRSGGPEPKT